MSSSTKSFNEKVVLPLVLGIMLVANLLVSMLHVMSETLRHHVFMTLMATFIIVITYLFRIGYFVKEKPAYTHEFRRVFSLIVGVSVLILYSVTIDLEWLSNTILSSLR